MAKLLDSETTVAVILGASDWSKAGLGKARSFHRSAAYFNTYLTRNYPEGLGLAPEYVLSLFDDVAPSSAQLARIRDFIKDVVLERKDSDKPIVDVLIYYVGHGTSDDGETLQLLVRDSGHGIEAQSSISTRDLAKVLKVAAPQQRRICIFDCCFSEAAVTSFAGMGQFDETVTKIAARNLVAEPVNPKRGTLLLCSSPRGSASIGQPNAERTLFTGALLQLLQEGSETRRDPMLSFSDIKDEVFEIMLQQYNGYPPRPALHQPNQQDGDLTRLPAFPNVRELRRRANQTSGMADEQPVAEVTHVERERRAEQASRTAKILRADRLRQQGSRQEDERQDAESSASEGRAAHNTRARRAIALGMAGSLVIGGMIYAARMLSQQPASNPAMSGKPHISSATAAGPTDKPATAPTNRPAGQPGSAAATPVKDAPIKPDSPPNPTGATAPGPPWSGYNLGIVACGVDDSAVMKSTEFLRAQGFANSSPTIRTNTRQKRLTHTSTLLFYDDKISDRVSRLAADLSNETGVPVRFAKGNSSLEKNQIVLDLVGNDCRAPAEVTGSAVGATNQKKLSDAEKAAIGGSAANRRVEIAVKLGTTRGTVTYQADVLFSFDSDQVQGAGREKLDDLLQKVNSTGTAIEFIITGYAAAGEAASVGLRRANACKNYLVSRGVKEYVIGTTGIN